MDPLVSVEWLASRLGDPGVAALDATLPPLGVVPPPDIYGRYLEGHIPGAVFFDIEALSDKSTPLPHTLPRAEVFAERMAELGIGSGMTLVVYEQEGVFSAPRAWWMLRTLGAREVFVLDGGLRAWAGAGYAVEAGPVQRPRAAFDATLDREAVVDFPGMQALIGGAAAKAQIADARSAARFSGTGAEPRAGLRAGHMPGALNVPYTDVQAEGRLLPAEALRAVFEAHGVDPAQPVVTTCGSGVTAAVLALALERCGGGPVRLYDGSWTEYAQQPGAEIVTG